MSQVGLTVRSFASQSNWTTLPVCPENYPTCGMHQPQGLPPTRERLLFFEFFCCRSGGACPAAECWQSLLALVVVVGKRRASDDQIHCFYFALQLEFWGADTIQARRLIG
jgi:hypothetical protein